MPKIITTTYKNPDLDGYGCVFAYAELLRAQKKDASAHIWGTPLLEVQWLIDTYSLKECEGESDDLEADIVLLDASDTHNVPEPHNADRVIEIIDHRKLNQADAFENAEAQIELVGAAATLVAERFRDADIMPSRDAALYLYGGILSNTQNFTGMVTDRDKEMAAWVKDVAGAADSLAHDMFTAKSDLSGARLQEQLAGDSKVFIIQGRRVGTMQLEIINSQKLVNERGEEIFSALTEFSSKNSCDYMFLNIKDIEKGTSIAVCGDEQTVELLKQWDRLSFSSQIGHAKNGLVRKMITAWIDTKLSS